MMFGWIEEQEQQQEQQQQDIDFYEGLDKTKVFKHDQTLNLQTYILYTFGYLVAKCGAFFHLFLIFNWFRIKIVT